MASTTPLTRTRIESYAALGDSFTEGLGDPAPDGSPMGWADRLATRLADSGGRTNFCYANLAVRGRLIDEIITEQIPRVVRLSPDLITFCAGGNDLLKPGSDPDRIADRYERAVAQLVPAARTVLLFTGFDTRGIPLLRRLRGKIATYTAHIRSIADRYGCPVADLWSLNAVHERRAWTDDRLHLSPYGHLHVAQHAARLLEGTPPPAHEWNAPAQERWATRRDDLQWAREHFVPWLGRHLTGRSSGDGVEPKRPDLLPL